MQKIISFLSIVVLSIFYSSAVFSATETSTMDVTVTVDAACTSSTTPVAFPNISEEGVDVFGQGSVTVTCPLDHPYFVAIGGGNNESASITQYRHVTDGSNYIPYTLSKNAVFTLEWGDYDYDQTYTYPQAYSLSALGFGAAHSHTVYARISGSHNTGLVSGSYSDTVIVTVYY